MKPHRELSRQFFLVALLLLTTASFNCHWFLAGASNRWPLMMLYDVVASAIVLAYMVHMTEPHIELYLLGGGLTGFADHVFSWIRGIHTLGGRFNWGEITFIGFWGTLFTWIVIRAAVRPQTGDLDGTHMWRSAGIMGAWTLWGSQSPDGRYMDYARTILGTACFAASIWLTYRMWRRAPEPGAGRPSRPYAQVAWVVGLIALAWVARRVPCPTMLLGAG